MNVNTFSTFVDLHASDDADVRKLLLEQSDAILVQETHLCAKECDDESSRMRVAGWNCAFSPAVECIAGRR
eukprot:9055558-Pyramimonas_sp.AAC.1